MRFAVDAHAIGRHLTGNEVYIRSLLGAMAAQDAESDFLAYVSEAAACVHVPQRMQTRTVSTNPFARLGYQLPRLIANDRPDVLHVQYTAPLGCQAPVIASVHDVSYIEHPEYFPRLRGLQLRLTVGHTVRRATRILTPSEFSRMSILRVYGDIEEEKVVMVPHAAAPEFRPISHEAAATAVRDRFGMAGPFVLCVGDLQPRKNQIGLIRAFAELARAYPQLRHSLALAGKETWFAGQVKEAAQASGVADRIRFLGFVTDAELLQLYNACDVFVFPSFYEGFGLPVLEAMACGRAVVCANTSSLPEVADSAAILVDPYASDEITRAMADLLLDAELRARMERLGQQRAAHFSWQRTARKTLDIYYEVAERNHPASHPVGSAPAVRG
jgi:glycosyltransferase involved in cell wall biosynthesis